LLPRHVRGAYPRLCSPSVPVAHTQAHAIRREAAHAHEQQRSFLLRALTLLLWLDWAKAAGVLQTPSLAAAAAAAASDASSLQQLAAAAAMAPSPPLFLASSPLKTSKAVLLALTAPGFLPLRGEGDVIRHLRQASSRGLRREGELECSSLRPPYPRPGPPCTHPRASVQWFRLRAGPRAPADGARRGFLGRALPCC
jgi:hypothetical protein